jgi:type I site-specific restriction endonuclease
VLSLRDTDTTKVINYSRADALAEHAIIPLKFTHIDAKAAFMRNGKRHDFASFHNASKNMGKAILFTSLQTQYAMDLLDMAVADWRETRKTNLRSKILVVAPSQALAKKYADYLQARHSMKPGLATINEGAGAMKAIKRFKRSIGADKTDCLVTVGMAYEGLDVKPITHIACLTRIRSKPWIEQMLARATRHDPQAGPWYSQEAHCFTPDDKMMHIVVDAIKKEQAPFCKQRHWGGSGQTGRPAVDLFGDLIPVESGAHRKRLRRLEVEASESQIVIPEKTPSEIESEIRQDIEYIVRRYASTKRIPFDKVNARMVSAFGKSRTEMTVDELRRALEWARQKFAIRYA